MNVQNNRVFSTTVARENLSNHLASVAPHSVTSVVK